MLKYLLVLAIMITSAPSEPKPQPKPKLQPPRVLIPLQNKKRDYVPPETVGVGKDCPFPTVRERIEFRCPCCGLWMATHVVYPHHPHCPKDGSVMVEIEKK